MASALNDRPRKRNRWYDQHLIPIGEPLRAFVSSLLGSLQDRVDATIARERARSIADQAVFRDLMDITTANLALAVLDPPASGALAVRRGNLTGPRSRYDHPAFGKQFPRLLDALHEAGIARVTTSTERGTVSSLAPSESFRGARSGRGRHPSRLRQTP